MDKARESNKTKGLGQIVSHGFDRGVNVQEFLKCCILRNLCGIMGKNRTEVLTSTYDLHVVKRWVSGLYPSHERFDRFIPTRDPSTCFMVEGQLRVDVGRQRKHQPMVATSSVVLM